MEGDRVRVFAQNNVAVGELHDKVVSHLEDERVPDEVVKAGVGNRFGEGQADEEDDDVLVGMLLEEGEISHAQTVMDTNNLGRLLCQVTCQHQ